MVANIIKVCMSVMLLALAQCQKRRIFLQSVCVVTGSLVACHVVQAWGRYAFGYIS